VLPRDRPERERETSSPVDVAITLALHQLAVAHGWLADVVVLVAQYGAFLLPLALAIAWFRVDRTVDSRREAILVGSIAAILAFALGLILERTLNLPRPFAELGFDPLLPHAADSSFPSDHTLVGVAFVGPMLWRARRLGVVLVVWALIVGLARVVAGLHYPSDIFASAVLALVLDVVVWLATRPVGIGRLVRNRGRRFVH
jgi:undecaprenyl-diphosphatase